MRSHPQPWEERDMHANGETSAIRLTPCTKCGGITFDRNRIADPQTGKQFEIRKCKTCDHVDTFEVPKAHGGVSA